MKSMIHSNVLRSNSVRNIRNAKSWEIPHIKTHNVWWKSPPNISNMFKHRIFTFLLKKMFDENMFWNIFHQTPSNTNFSSFLKNVKILYIHKPFKHFIKHQKLTMFDEMFERFAPALTPLVFNLFPIFFCFFRRKKALSAYVKEKNHWTCLQWKKWRWKNATSAVLIGWTCNLHSIEL